MLGSPVYNSSNPSNFLQLATSLFLARFLPLLGQRDHRDGIQIVLRGRGISETKAAMLSAGRSFKQLDFAIYKDTKITERLNMQLRAEFFNLFNHPNFSNPLLPNFIANAAPNATAACPTGLLSGSREVSCGAYGITATGDVGIGNPFLGGGGPRGIQLAAKFSF